MEYKQLQSNGFVAVENDHLPEYYVDGVSTSFLGTPVSKITFHSVKELGDDGKEVRMPKVRLVIQTGALVEFCRMILAIGTENKEGLQAGYDINKMQVGHLLEGLTVPHFKGPGPGAK